GQDPVLNFFARRKRAKEAKEERNNFYSNLTHFYLYPNVWSSKPGKHCRAWSWSPLERQTWWKEKLEQDEDFEKQQFSNELKELRRQKAGKEIEKKLEKMFELGYYSNFQFAKQPDRSTGGLYVVEEGEDFGENINHDEDDNFGMEEKTISELSQQSASPKPPPIILSEQEELENSLNAQAAASKGALSLSPKNKENKKDT
ncbi:unnamed protein product, partial [Amoebophrya sp. A120]